MTKGKQLAEQTEGLFITFEGGDGVGKSTQISMLAAFLSSHNCAVVQTREPGGSPGAEAIRELLVTGDVDRWSPTTEALLMFAARVDHVERTVLPALARGAIVLSDRFADSTMAYQGFAGALGEAKVAQLYELSLGDFQPDLTIILAIDDETALARAQARNKEDKSAEDRFEEKGQAFQAAVNKAFLQIAADNPERCIVIEAGKSVEAVAQDIQDAIRLRFGARLGLHNA